MSIEIGAPAQLLVVEDNTDVREPLVEALELEGYRVAGAANGRQALEYLKSNPAPVLIILDLIMPVMEGFEFRARLLRDPALAEIPVIVTSAIPPGADGASRFHAAAYLQKPIDMYELLALVSRYCSRLED